MSLTEFTQNRISCFSFSANDEKCKNYCVVFPRTVQEDSSNEAQYTPFFYKQLVYKQQYSDLKNQISK